MLTEARWSSRKDAIDKNDVFHIAPAYCSALGPQAQNVGPTSDEDSNVPNWRFHEDQNLKFGQLRVLYCCNAIHLCYNASLLACYIATLPAITIIIGVIIIIIIIISIIIINNNNFTIIIIIIIAAITLAGIAVAVVARVAVVAVVAVAAFAALCCCLLLLLVLP